MPRIRDDATKKVLDATIGKANLILQQEYYNYKSKATPSAAKPHHRQRPPAHTP